MPIDSLAAEAPNSNKNPWHVRMAWMAYASLCLLAVGLFTSTSLCSLSLALMYPPGIYFTWHDFKNLRWHALPTPAWALIAFTIIGIISCAMNMETIDNPLKAALKVKYFLIGALSIPVFSHIIKSFITSKLIKGQVLSLVI